MTRSGRREQYCEMINMIICSSSRGQPIIPSSAFVQLYKHLTQNLGIKLNKYTCCGDTYLNKGWTPCLAGPSPAHNQPAQPSQHILGKKAAPSYPCTLLYPSLCWNDQDKEPIHHCNDRSKDDLNGQLTRMEGGLKEQMDVLMFLILAGLHCSGKALSKS